MLEVIVGWLKGNINFPDIRDFVSIEVFQFKPPAVVEESRREQGRRFEIEEVTRLMDRLEGFESVTFLNPRTGTEITLDNIEQFLSKDGGLDYKILIVTPTDKGAKIVAGKIRKIMERGDY